MYHVEQLEPSEDFKEAWMAARQHIHRQADAGLNWLRISLDRPFADHLSFRIGNQLFFIFIEAAEFEYASGKKLFERLCKDANAIPCLMPMKKWLGKWTPEKLGWGLVNVSTKNLINPLDYVSAERIEMTDWELHDFAIQVVCTYLKKEGKVIFLKQSFPEVYPSIWFEDKHQSHYVVVRAGRYPESDIAIPDNIEAIKQGCSKLANIGFFASVIFANSDDPFDPNAKTNGNFMALYRGHGVFPKYSGLQKL